MPWGFVAGAAIGAVGSAISSGNAEDAADNATAAQERTAESSLQLGREQLNWAKTQYSDAAPMRDWAFQTAKDVSTQQLASAKQQDSIAADYSDYNKTTFRPLEQSMVANAQAYDTPERRAAAQASARADVEQAFGSTQDATSRAITRTGASIGSGRGMAQLMDTQFAKAKAVAGATTAAERNVETQGYARMADAANLGRGIASNQATAAGLAVNAGNSAVTNATTGVGVATSGMAPVQQAYGTAIGATGQAGSLYGQVANRYMTAANDEAQQWAALGSAAGRYMAYGK